MKDDVWKETHFGFTISRLASSDKDAYCRLSMVEKQEIFKNKNTSDSRLANGGYWWMRNGYHIRISLRLASSLPRLVHPSSSTPSLLRLLRLLFPISYLPRLVH